MTLSFLLLRCILPVLACLFGPADGNRGEPGDSPAADARPDKEGQPSLTIGVTGHRLLTDLDRLNAGIEEALRRIERAYPGRRLALLSPLAEGADRLVAQQVLRRPGATLVVPLPLAKAEYLKDFETRASRDEFEQLLGRAARVFELPAAPARTAAYDAIGRYVVDESELLIAVWDGQGAQGQGGTGEVVHRARAQGKPVVLVRAGNRKPGTSEPTTLGKEQGRVITERLPGSRSRE